MRKKIAWTLREFAKNLYVFPAASCSVLDGVAEGGVGGSSRRGSKLAVYGVIRVLGLLLLTPIAPAKLPSSIGSGRGLRFNTPRHSSLLPRSQSLWWSLMRIFFLIIFVVFPVAPPRHLIPRSVQTGDTYKTLAVTMQILSGLEKIFLVKN